MTTANAHRESGDHNGRSDEDFDSDGIPDTTDDSDNDGVVDFDERNRFATSFSSADWNGDDVQDGADIRGYLFNNDGAYSRRSPDIDNDGKRKEVDKDNDYASDNGTVDGCEDRDRDGKDEVGETNSTRWSRVCTRWSSIITATTVRGRRKQL